MVRHTCSVTLPRDAPRVQTCAVPARVRGLVRSLLRHHPQPVVDDALLLTDELLTSVIEAPALLRGVRLAYEDAGPGSLTIEVDYLESALPTRARPAEDGFLGRWLLERLAASWGVRHAGVRCTVWAEFSLGR